MTLNSAFTNPGWVTLSTALQLNQNFDNAGTVVLNAASTLRAGRGGSAAGNNEVNTEVPRLYDRFVELVYGRDRVAEVRGVQVCE